ncbi:uncharacterized protein LOC62_03G003652 [Vanrija pseudolonga]|uniref:Invertebrate defensins family profile domain-containing protein n=1 Tax=Vanrija pseudolonga TaxID=143232 RepID=A0AAF0Y4X0_9TREE|nr:hypothetical protein LOC62_03G003652 [Vanrija pseudolonga]
MPQSKAMLNAAMKFALATALILAASAIAAPTETGPADLESRTDTTHELDTRAACLHSSSCGYFGVLWVSYSCKDFCRDQRREFAGFMSSSNCNLGKKRCCCK